MKIFLTVAVAASTILLLVLPMELQGAPQRMSARRFQYINSNAQLNGRPYAKTPYHHRKLDTNTRKASKVTAQVHGIEVNNCGISDEDLQCSLRFLTYIFGDLSDQFGLLVDCEDENHVKVRVDVPPDTLFMEVEFRNGKSPLLCIRLLAERKK